MKAKKISTITKMERVNNPEKYNYNRDKTLETILKSYPRMNLTVTISSKPF